MQFKPTGTSLGLSVPVNYALVCIYEEDDYYTVDFMRNGTASKKTVSLPLLKPVRYLMTPEITSEDPKCIFYDSNGNEVMFLNDNYQNDPKGTKVNVYKSYVDFLWINN